MNSKLSVSRHDLELSDIFFKIDEIVILKIEALIQKNKDLFDNVYGTLNYIYTKIPPKREFWFHSNEKSNIDAEAIFWKQIDYPKFVFNIDEEPFYKYGLQQFNLCFRKKQMLHLVTDISSYLSYHHNTFNFNRIMTIGWLKNPLTAHTRKNYLLVLDRPPFATFGKYTIPFIKLPDSWNKILFVQVGSKRHQVFALSSDANLKQFLDLRIYASVRIDGLKIRKEDIIDKKWALAFLLESVQNYREEKWIALCENYSEVMQHVFDTLSLESTYILDDDDVIEVAFNKWEKLSTEEEKEKIRPTTNIDDFIVSEL